jgi:menaquinone-specific isochorismate synthase
MLEEARSARNNLAWLCDSQHKKAVYVRRKQASPAPSGLCFYAPDFALNDAEPWLCGEEIEPPAAHAAREVPALEHRAEPSAADFNCLHEEILARIGRGEFQKVVPIVCEELEFARPLEPAMFPALWRAHDHRFSFGFAFGGEGLCGITPELLLSVRDGVLHTMALAGTGKADGPDLLADPKERREHELVIEHILMELREWGQPDVGATQERVYGPLKHLYTPIRLELNRKPEFMELIVRLHPTAALGGWPRKPAVEWLERQAFHTGRGRFGAPFGYQEDGRMECVVAIRCVQWKGKCVKLGAGCGVVTGSEALREWKELQLKRESVYRGLGLPL